MNIVFVRHGSTELNHKHVYAGVIDSEISQKGIEEIKSIKKYLQKIKFHEVYSSPLKRAVKTTELLDENYKIDSRLSEMNFGIFEGLSYSEIESKYARESKAWVKDTLNYKIPKGESLIEVFNRTKAFIEEVSSKRGDILVVTHGGVIACALSLVFNQYDYFYRFKIMHGTASVISIEDGYMYIKAINCRDNIMDVL
ncbi:putative adenosylcobalamin/alpha-ribazole phosphatase [Clostridium pasteurianum DSM 525 = ATCC 6013]|uniref:Phosphoglycerate mutase n=1 Tax=Clostridium pasteurianum DSM 525 = ATCC 6013 TaxID=1262449 RepID=A0A0H3JBA5_CLOPA|nr:histidine phosphatase family protein [Clostridium pasteurianum]AJA49390.1 putative adenosylcobalamin/alpha-ribazole phosphatase [Clostridium pasteurianum DSM 525 = ATCC 6013]AJA53378.1 putative adenosylcobalamin/alpha-ribazole phosphatase [Clostridium pasteurianum DSM 525 = ATCC 6013]AOZ76562.1 alpha-ribazole phosphatase [Clostridium pasteurianum DSM 525 = ATCC 6013]AOZ80359.1 alpha-ribazole phosphatase [Clostridium pasteurianum]ELP58494.1 alpha-ribazole phosphatase [Clostridium pasteurianu